MTKNQNNEEFLATARKRFAEAESDESAIRDEAKKDLRFVAGDQWDSAVKANRIAGGRPAMTFSRCHTFVQQVANEARQMRGEIKFVPTEDNDKDTAEIYEGLARHIQYNSKARVAYETAVDYSAGGSFGYYRFLSEYCDDDGFNQEVKVVPVFDPFAVYGVLIPACFGQEPRYGFVVEELSKEEFQQQYPNSSISDWESAAKDSGGWMGTETVRVAEYWYVETTPKTLYQLEDGSVTDKLPEGQKPVKTRTVEQQKIKACKMNGYEVLEGSETEWPGKRIPIFPVLSKGIILDGKPQLFSVIRFQRDPQQLINFYKTRIAETLGTAPIQPYVVYEGQIAGHEREWNELNTKLRPYLTVKGVDVAGKPLPLPQRQVFEPPIGALSEAAMQEIDDMKATAGIYDASLGAKSNETSGLALQRRQQQSSMTNMHFIDNLERSFDDSGRELAAVIPIYYDAPRAIRILGQDETPKIVKINQAFQDHNGQKKHYQIGGDGASKYDVVVTMGRAFSTKRMESFDMMSQILSGNKDMLPMVGDIFFKNSDLAGADQLSERFKKMLPPQLQDDQSGDPEQKLQQMQAQMQALGQQHQMLVDQLNQAKDLLANKQMELESRERIEQMKVEASITIAEINTKAQEMQMRAKLEQDMASKLHVAAHDRAMQADAQDHQTSMQQESQLHEADMTDKNAMYTQQQMAQQAEQQPTE